MKTWPRRMYRGEKNILSIFTILHKVSVHSIAVKQYRTQSNTEVYEKNSKIDCFWRTRHARKPIRIIVYRDSSKWKILCRVRTCFWCASRQMTMVFGTQSIKMYNNSARSLRVYNNYCHFGRFFSSKKTRDIAVFESVRHCETRGVSDEKNHDVGNNDYINVHIGAS